LCAQIALVHSRQQTADDTHQQHPHGPLQPRAVARCRPIRPDAAFDERAIGGFDVAAKLLPLITG
jgi:hypothetical protein